MISNSHPKLFVLLDRVRSAYNVGSIFRICDSAAIDQLLLCGYTAFPPHPKLDKTALGSLKTVSWSHHCDSLKAAAYLKQRQFKIIVMENTPLAKNLYHTSIKTDTCLVFGHEETGVSPELLALSDAVVKIPHFGTKDSLNVAVAAGVAIYEFRRQLYRHYPQILT